MLKKNVNVKGATNLISVVIVHKQYGVFDTDFDFFSDLNFETYHIQLSILMFVVLRFLNH